MRKYALTTQLDWLPQKNEWSQLNALAMVESTRIIEDKQTTERRYCLTSLTDLNTLAEAVSSHWTIENSQH